MEKLPVGVVFDVRSRKFVTNVVMFVAYCVHVGRNECGGLAIAVRNFRSSWGRGPLLLSSKATLIFTQFLVFLSTVSMSENPIASVYRVASHFLRLNFEHVTFRD
jgi:hypothetical protein